MSTLKTNNIQHVDRSEPSILIDTSGSVSIAGTLTYEDVTNIDSVGIITARSDVSIADKIVHTGDTNTAIRFPSADTVTVETGGSERLRIGSTGKILIGDDTSENTMGLNANVQTFGTDASTSGFAIKRGSNDAQAAFLVLSKSRNTSVGSRTILQNGDEVGNIFFVADDGTDLISNTAAIKSQIGGAPGANDTPGNLSFWTTSDGANSASRRMTINSGGLIGIGQATPTHMLHVDSSSASDSTATAFFKGRIIRFDGAAASDSPRLNFSLDGTDKAQILCHRTNIGLDIATLVAEPIKFKVNTNTEAFRILSGGAVVVAGTSAYSDGTFGEAKLQFNTKSGNHIGACSVADSNNNITHVLFKNPTGAIASVGTHNSDFVVLTGNSERLRVDSAGALLVAHTSGRNNFNSAVSTEHAPIIQLEGTNQRRAISITSSNTSDGGMLILARQNGSPGSNTVVSSGNQVGRIDFQASGGTNMETVAVVSAEVDGTPGDNDMPGRLLFKTTADGANAASEKMRITSGGQVNIGGNFTQTSYGFSVRGGAVDQNVQFSNTKSTNGNIHYFGITLTNAGYGQALFGHTGHTTQSSQAAWMGNSGDDVAGGVGVKVFRGGSVIKKGQPAFQAHSGASSTASGNYLIFTTEVFDVRGDYNASTGIFTAPIAGKYLFTLTGVYTMNNASPPFKLTWHVNNSNYGVAAEWQDSSISNSYNTIGNSSIIFDLAENDTVRLYIEGSNFHISSIQSRFCGYLLG